VNKKSTYQTPEQLQEVIEELRIQLEEANETIEAIRTGQVDALVVQDEKGHQLYTLKGADQTYRVIIEKMTEGAVTVNREGLILYCNSQFANMVDVPLSNVIGMHFHEFIAPEITDQYQEFFSRCWKGDCKGEMILVTGEQRTPVQLSVSTLELDEGVSLSIILTDLTAQKKTQMELKQSNEELEKTNRALESSNHDLQQFASVASHDLQEPLRKIQIFSNLMKERQTELTPETKKYLEKIIHSSKRMKSLIIDILNYSSLSAIDVPLQCIDLNELVNELLIDFDLIIQEKNASVKIGKLACIDLNKGQIRQVLQNIVSNALKFSNQEKPPCIEISGKYLAEKSFESVEKAEGPYFQITIKDNGIGFDEKYAYNIFTLFERLNSKDDYEGTGIGLAVAKKIIDKHNGLIAAHSVKGSGAEFIIILPVKQASL
jgi:PAS domain S-box-containing protein